MAEREKLPPRRPAITRSVTWARVQGAHRFTMTIGFDPESGCVREVFASGAQGSDMDATISDFCVTLSIMLQSGVDLRPLRASMLKVSDPSSGGEQSLHASVLGAIVDAVVEASHG